MSAFPVDDKQYQHTYSPMQFHTDKAIKDLFRQFDTKGEGTYSKRLFQAVLTRCGCGTEGEVEKLLTTYERMGTRSADGPAAGNAVNYEEFFSWLFDVKAVSSQESLGHSLRGVSVHHLATTFMDAILAAGLDRSATIYKIESAVILPKSKETQCPRDQQMGSAYVDAIHGEDHAGIATIMLSYTWGYEIGDIVDALDKFCQDEQIDPRKARIWMCCLCINQHRVKAAQAAQNVVPFDDFRREFGERVRGVGHVVALMAPWHNPFYLKRVWCDFEMFTAVASSEGGIRLDIIMPPREERDFRAALLKPTGVDLVWQACGSVKVEEAEASIKEDRDCILDMISKGPGFAKLDSLIVRKLQHWMVDCGEKYLKGKLRAKDAEDLQDLLKLCENVNKLLRGLGEIDRAAHIVKEGLHIHNEAGTLETPQGADMLRQLGILERRRENLDAASKHFSRALQITEKNNTLETPEGALLLNSIAQVEIEQGGDGIETLLRAKEIAVKIGKLETNIGALILRALANSEERNGNVSTALEAYEQVMTIYREKTSSLKSPAGVNLLESIAVAKQNCQDLPGAIAAVEEAKRIRIHLCTLDTVEGARLLRRLGDMQKLNGDIRESDDTYQHSLSIFRQKNSIRTREAMRLIRTMDNKDNIADVSVIGPGEEDEAEAEDKDACKVTLESLPTLRTTELTGEPYSSIIAPWRSGQPFTIREKGVEQQMEPWPALADAEDQLRSHAMLVRLDKQVARAFQTCVRLQKGRIHITVKLPTEQDIPDPTLPQPPNPEGDRPPLPANVQWLGQSIWAFANEYYQLGVIQSITVFVEAPASPEHPDYLSLLRTAINAAKADDHAYFGARMHNLPIRGNDAGNQQVLVDTVTQLNNREKRTKLMNQAFANLERWRAAAAAASPPGSPMPIAGRTFRAEREKKKGKELMDLFGGGAGREEGAIVPRLIVRPRPEFTGGGVGDHGGLSILMLPSDWGDVTGALTRHTGAKTAVLNMANAVRFGGSYLKGSFAQEENITRRTNLHFTMRFGTDLVPIIFPNDPHINLFFGYSQKMTDLINAVDGNSVYLSKEPLIVVKRGQEKSTSQHASWSTLPDEEVVPVWELRAAFPDLRLPGMAEDPEKVEGHKRRTMSAIFATLRKAGIRQAVLGAIGCGVFGHDAGDIARLYAQEVKKPENMEHFRVIAFAIYAAPGVKQGVSGDNFTPFADAFEREFDSPP